MSNSEIKLNKINDQLWEIPKTGDMRVPGRIYADEKLLHEIKKDKSLEQVANVAHLPGIVGYSMAMPDIHWGYGFPIGGVAATDPDEGGVISPGGVGYDINCGVRVIRTDLKQEDVQPRVRDIVNELFKNIPCGVGASKAIQKLSKDELRKVMENGARWAVEGGFGEEEDLERTEENGALPWANPDAVSDRAISRGVDQVGTLGSGNHFLEVDVIEEVYHQEAAEVFRLLEGGIAIQIHTGSRGFGHQTCDDSLRDVQHAVQKYNIRVPDKQLACVPVSSPEGQKYLGAMASAANFAWANRQVIMDLVIKSLKNIFGRDRDELGVMLIYDVCHNIAKLEEHDVGGVTKQLCVHRKGATRAFPPGHADTPAPYKSVGQPVLIPGDMGTCSFICVGAELSMKETFGSSCHGAGRVMSRNKAIKRAKGRAIHRELEDQGIYVRSKGRHTLAEEMSEAYKDVESVVNVMHNAGITLKVAKLRPLCVVKG